MIHDAAAGLRRTVYGLVGAVAVGIGLGKLAGAENVFEPSRYRPPTEDSFGAGRAPEVTPRRVWPERRPEPTPMFSSNDKSRWATVKALVEDGTYVVGKRDFPAATEGFTDTGIIFREDYNSLDKVMNPQTGEFFSSKPPLLPTLVAAGYYALYHWAGWTLDKDRWWVVVTLLVCVNVLPFSLYLWCLARLIEAHGKTDFGRVFAFTVAACGTFLTPFLTTFTNHVPAACGVLFAAYFLLRPRATGSAFEAFLAGLCAGFAAAFDLPALAFAGGLFVPLALTRPGTAVTGFLPGLLVPVAAALYCNYLAIGTVVPAYGEFGGPWYEYAGGEWKRIKAAVAAGSTAGRGVDYAREPRGIYAFHLTLGHHGWFSLTPVWLVGAAGLVMSLAAAGPDLQKAWATRRAVTGPVWTLNLFAVLTAVVSVVVFAFYVWQTTNYGGNTSGPRWLMWLSPLWVLGLLPAADRLARSGAGRGLGAVLLAASVFSVSYPAWNPWRYPWLQQLLEQTGFVRY